MTFQIPNPDELVNVFGSFEASLIWIAQDALESVGIESFIFDENSSFIGYGRYLPMRLMVYADKADEARECLRELGIEK